MTPSSAHCQKMRVLLLGVLVVWIANRTRGSQKSLEQQLINDLLRGYNRDAHPIPEQNRSSYVVTFGLELVQLVNVDDKNQIITTNVWIRQKWTNLLLTWEPKHYGGIKRVRIDPKLLWIPDVVLYNSVDSEFSGGLEKYKTRVIIDSDGTNSWYSPASFRSTCPIDVTHFPFDEQTCTMKFGSWTFEIVDLDIHADNSPLHSTQYVKSAEWDLMVASRQRNVQSYACCDYPFSDVTIEFVFKRKPLFYIFNLIIPCIIIMSMVLLGFFLPPESGERITLSITVLLAMAVFLQLAAENLPRNSENVPVMEIFYITVMLEVALSLVATCYILHIHHRNSGTAVIPVPRWVNKCILNKLGKLLGVKKPVTEDSYHLSAEKDFKRLSLMKKDFESRLCKGRIGHGVDKTTGARTVVSSPEEFCLTSFVNSVECTATENDMLQDKKDTTATGDSDGAKTAQGVMVLVEGLKHRRQIEKNQEEWRHLAMVLDRLFFWIFVLLISFSLFILLARV
ncbi:PREDICTED: neuronal acetylcholine receptor subunit beta-3-like [Acropora digitifera]|uniref:neuronal acetylcholine receptor subunit beta-3-like n=1 Tax=Acropora digitifera TaxID=70779 RepID=UPI00077A7691|nr:PREDICTED: neuronal acetylcholine receptor subunit beta-3-like [Acropora digitifera]